MESCFDEECAQLIEACLRGGGIRLRRDQLKNLISNIEADMVSFSDPQSETTFREAHDDLRKLWLATAEDDPSPGQIRALISGLSKRATEQVDRQFLVVMEQLSLDRSSAVDFKTWARTAQAGDLIRVSRILAAEGARVVSGRSRGCGKRSASRLSPQIMGVVRGELTGNVQRGGRPDNGAKIDLVMRLALSWFHATGNKPKRGRSDKTGFGGLVFLVFGRLGIRDETDDESSVVHVLRQYWSLIPKETSKSDDG